MIWRKITNSCFKAHHYFMISISYAMTFFLPGVHLLQLLMPILVSMLVEPELLASTSQHARKLHDNVLQRLIKVGPQYPAQFRHVMQVGTYTCISQRKSGRFDE